MTRTPTGRLDGNDLIITRTFRAPIDDVWTSVTSSESTARWIGPWEGDAGVGKTIRLQLLFEQGAPWSQARIDACERPRHLAADAGPGWEYYLDNLVAARAGEPLPKFDEDYPAQKAYYEQA